ncbi:MAG: prephenate dehydrogenase [Candidatus Methylomirabilales bacterium]
MGAPIPRFATVGVIGLGLIGGSVAHGCRTRGLAARVIGVDTDPGHRRTALRRGLVDEALEQIDSGLEQAELVLLAVPVGAMERVAAAVGARLAPQVVVTDVGSVKGAIVPVLERALGDGVQYVPGHPIAGTERSGPEAASGNLFEGHLCVLTPTACTASAATQAVRALWEGLGARVVTMAPGDHDEIFGAVSHLPHVVAYALVNAVLDREGEGVDLVQFSAGGFRDFTRIAASNPGMWRDILLLNREAILRALTRFRGSLERITEAIAQGDGEAIMAELERARELKGRLT